MAFDRTNRPRLTGPIGRLPGNAKAPVGTLAHVLSLKPAAEGEAILEHAERLVFTQPGQADAPIGRLVVGLKALHDRLFEGGLGALVDPGLECSLPELRVWLEQVGAAKTLRYVSCLEARLPAGAIPATRADKARLLEAVSTQLAVDDDNYLAAAQAEIPARVQTFLRRHRKAFEAERAAVQSPSAS